MTDRSIQISLFPPRIDGRPTHETGRALRTETTISELISSLTSPPEVVESKHLAPAWSPIAYSGERRLAVEAVSVCALVYDCDDPGYDFQSLGERVHAKGWIYVIHETHTAGRARLILPLGTDCPPASYAALWTAIALELGLEPDQSCTDLARLFYAPSCPPCVERDPPETGGRVLLDPGEWVSLDPARAPTPAPREKVKPPENHLGKNFDLEKLREEISEYHNPERRAQLEALIDGTLRIAPGTRETTLHPLLGSLSHLRNNPPEDVVAEMLRRCLSMREGAETMLEEWVDKAIYSWSRGTGRKEVLDQQVAVVEKFFRDETWKTSLKQQTDSKGGVVGMKPLECNLIDVLANDEAFQGFIRWNVLKNEVEISGGALEKEPIESLGVPLAVWLQKSNYNCPVSAEKAGQALFHHALHHHYDPVAEFLSRLPMWDGIPRVSNLLLDYAQAQGARDWIQVVTRKFFIAAIARARRPGCQVDNTLVLQGEQGGGKTSFVRVMGAGFHVETSLDLHNKDAVMTSAGNWLVELGELASLRKSDVESVRNFLTRKEDQIRLPYGRTVKTMPRRCVFIGTTNSKQPLSDPEGNRRFWVVSVGTIDTEGLELVRDQVWAEALQAYESGEQWWLTSEQAVRAKSEASIYESEDTMQVEILSWLEDQKTWPKFISAHEIGKKVLNKLPGFLSPQEVSQINRVLHGFGWERVRKRMAGKQVWAYVVPSREVMMGNNEEAA